jgi:hypothetical protein
LERACRNEQATELALGQSCDYSIRRLIARQGGRRSNATLWSIVLNHRSVRHGMAPFVQKVGNASMDFKQKTIGDFIESENLMLSTALQRYGAYYTIASIYLCSSHRL